MSIWFPSALSFALFQSLWWSITDSVEMRIISKEKQLHKINKKEAFCWTSKENFKGNIINIESANFSRIYSKKVIMNATVFFYCNITRVFLVITMNLRKRVILERWKVKMQFKSFWHLILMRLSFLLWEIIKWKTRFIHLLFLFSF